MMYRVICLLLLYSPSFGQSFNAAAYQGMGNTGIAIGSVYSSTNNAAGLGVLSSATAAIAYQPHHMSKDLRYQALYLGMPFHQLGAAGLSVHSYGIVHTSRFLQATLSYVRSFGGVIHTSISANYHNFSVQGYQSDHAYSADLGLLLNIWERLNLGFVFRNITFTSFNDETEQHIPVEIGFGSLYRMSDELSLALDTYYQHYEGVDVRAGICYGLGERIFFRGGVSLHPRTYYAGIGVRLKEFQIDFSSSFHYRLGTSPQLALAYEF